MPPPLDYWEPFAKTNGAFSRGSIAISAHQSQVIKASPVLQLTLISQGDKPLQSHNFDFIGVEEMRRQAAVDIIISQCPSIAAQNQIRLRARSTVYHLGKADHLEG